MGSFLDELQENPQGRTGRKSLWPEMRDCLPSDVAEDVLAAFLSDTIEVPRIKEMVESRFDVPSRSLSTWRNWAREHRAGRL